MSQAQDLISALHSERQSLEQYLSDEGF